MKKILIIDDESYILLMLKKMLERAGYEIDIASNGNEGVALFSRTRPDLVITDIIMPEKEGLETIREMKRMKPGLKIIAISGGGKVSADSYLDMARMFGASRVIPKPFTKNEMLTAVTELLGKENAGSEFGGAGGKEKSNQEDRRQDSGHNDQ